MEIDLYNHHRIMVLVMEIKICSKHISLDFHKSVEEMKRHIYQHKQHRKVSYHFKIV
jgi:hypothetical protein